MALTNEQKKLLYWQVATEGMDLLEIPKKGYKAGNEKDLYDRFTTFVRELVEKSLNGQKTGVDYFDTADGLPGFNEGSIDGNWWEQAKRLGDGKPPENNTIPAINNPKEEEVTAVMNTLLPLYRATKESYDRRPFWQWITNHSQYTAERDTAKALRGLMMSLTGSTAEEIDARLDTYSKEVKSNHLTPKEISKMVSGMRKGGKLDFSVFTKVNEGITVEEALQPDPEAYFSDDPMQTLEEYVEFNPDQVEKENAWSKETEEDFESDDFELKSEHITKTTKWGKAVNEEVLAIFDGKDEDSIDNVIADDDDRIRLSIPEFSEKNGDKDKLSPIAEEDSFSVSQNIEL